MYGKACEIALLPVSVAAGSKLTSESVEQLYAFFYSLPKSVSSPVNTSSALPPPTATNPLSPLSSSPTDPTRIDTTPDAGPAAKRSSGWNTFNPRTEFARQGLGSRTRAWRFTDINRDYTFCPTYPSKLAVPSRISDSTLAYAAKYRSKARIPALTYLHWANHASITRSSQPMVGIKGNRSAQDERLVECIFTSHLNPETAYVPTLSPSPSSSGMSTPAVYGATPTNLIIDARPTTNAMANVAKGAGTENMDHYKWGDKAYLGIDNIHVMRNSLKAVVEALAEANACKQPVDKERLRRSGWLKHLTAILDGSLMIVRNVHINSSHVLIHCSDGWDRTSQLSAVAQLCLDPYYRTIEGFQVLVEKDWLSFGHMFNQRSGHLYSGELFTATPDNLDGGDAESDDDFGVAVKGAQAFFATVSKRFTASSHLKEISPVFHQFLDCVWQIRRQFPERFEFTDDYLLDLQYHLYACQFGTFLFDSERQRRSNVTGKPNIERTVSAWEWFDLPTQQKRYVSTEYNPALDDRETRDSDADLGVLLPDPRDVKFWHGLFKRPDEEMNIPYRFREDPPPPIFEAPTPGPVDPLGPSAIPKRPGLVTSDSAASSPSSPASAFPLPKVGKKEWSWGGLGNGLSTGALSAFNQIKAGATDAISQLRERPEDEMIGYAPGTGIGEAGASTARTERWRVPSETNPWGEELPAVSKPRQPRRSETEEGPDVLPRREDVTSNPWEERSVPSLADLSLHSVGESKRTKEPLPLPSEKVESKVDPDEEAALSGSKAWDPLGAL